MAKLSFDGAVAILERGGAIHYESAGFTLHHPLEGVCKLSDDIGKRLIESQWVILVNCGCTGFWYGHSRKQAGGTP